MEYIATLNNQFSDLVSKFNKFQLANHDISSVKRGHEILNLGTEALSNLKTHVRALETLLSDCQDVVKEIEDDLSHKPKDDEFVYHTKNGMLSYKGRDFIKMEIKATAQERTPVIENVKEQQQELPILHELGNNFTIKTPIVKSLKDIKPMFSYFNGDSNTPRGLYCCLKNNVYLRVPFPEVIDSTKDYDRYHSIKCKHGTKEECDFQRSRMAKHYSSSIRQCNFAHGGDKLIKIGYPARCPNMPHFGNHNSLRADLSRLTIDDIKSVLLYGLHDVALSALWFDAQPKKSNIIISDLDKA